MLKNTLPYLQPPLFRVQSPWKGGVLNVVDKELIEKLRKKYYESPPDGMTKQDILHMSDSDLLDMDYFLTDEDDEDIGEEGFYIFN